MNREVQTARDRLELASQLTLSALEILRPWSVRHAGDELVRRQISLACRTLRAVAGDLASALCKKRLPIEDASRCPHCGWLAPPRSVPLCPRCHGPREVRDEIPGGDSRSASGA